MTDKDDGGAVHPVCVEVLSKHEDGRISAAFFKNEGGLSLRDWFAGQALAGLSNVGNVELYDHAYERIAVEAYRFADAMLKARKGE